MTEQTVKLLRSLAIDRDTPIASPRASGWNLRRGSILAIAMLAIAVVVMLAIAAAFTLAPKASKIFEQATPAPAPLLDPPKPATANAPSILDASGYVVARRRATVASEVTGKVTEVLVEEGMKVQAGQLLARLDSVLAESDLALAQSRAESASAVVASASADLEDARRILSRLKTLAQNKWATEADLTKADARAAVLAGQLRQAESQLQTAKLDALRSASVLDKNQIRAPFAGVVVDRSAQPGEVISPLSVGGFTRTGICTIVDMDSIEIEVDVNETFIGRVVPGGSVSAVLDAYPDWSIPGSVIAIVPAANRDKATVRVRIRIEQKDARILPDMAVKVKFLEAENAK
jgi:HlyD family secretion protein